MKSVPAAIQRISAQFVRLNDESRLSFAAAAGCFAVGLPAVACARLLPDGWHLEALIVIGAFYFLLGLGGLFKGSSYKTAQEVVVSNRNAPSRKFSEPLPDEAANLQEVA